MPLEASEWFQSASVFRRDLPRVARRWSSSPPAMCGKPCEQGSRTLAHSDRVCRAGFSLQKHLFRHAVIGSANRAMGILADFRGEPTDSFSVCLLMRTRRGVSLETMGIRRGTGTIEP
jgi:hypothetical protein